MRDKTTNHSFLSSKSKVIEVAEKHFKLTALDQNHQQLPAGMDKMKEEEISQQKNLIRELILEKDPAIFLYFTSRLTQQLNIPETCSWFIKDLLPSLEEESRNWVLETILEDELIQVIGIYIEDLAKILIQKKFILGKDFTIFNKKLLITNTVFDSIVAENPIAQQLKTLDNVLVLEELNLIVLAEEALGVPFFDNLIQRAINRFPSLSDAKIDLYMFEITFAVADRFNIDRQDLLEWFFFCVQPHYHKDLADIYFDCTGRPPEEDCCEWVEDIIAAAGGERIKMVDKNGTIQKGFNKDCLKLFHDVCLLKWKKISIYDLLPKSKSYAFENLLDRTIEDWRSNIYLFYLVNSHLYSPGEKFSV